ncbi:bifunctional riboflavin kinase/FAD synthetase [Paenibacillus sp. J2TS4]|uniref:bifunctional riboflavin kinase/FAD synthetase n=1 Tax=Paenibacillus sp. J2TS4 TaxID=2807194 RepID=UPI001B12AA3B|nr:bifunctional riboflavin kinase/FAD synthetase [Paenibacillus sp. J2TS4]GIP33117.1 riboflavin biosynthesis protein RibC [Paenibacillus sp. J2TS4]
MQDFHIHYPTRLPLEGMPSSQVVAIGDFDGVHLGHREVITRAIKTGARLNLPASVMTFHPHPRVVLGQSKYEHSLTPLSKKLEIFKEMGIQYTYVVEFRPEFARLTPAEFVEQYLLALGVNSVIVGFDFKFGHQGSGTPDTLCELSHGQFTVEVVRPYLMDGDKVSSTRIRDHLLSGQMEAANMLLGRRYSVRGIVVEGDKRGRTIGFPTANIDPDEPFVMPLNGVYAAKVSWEGHVYYGAANIGVKPTFSGDRKIPVLEVHLLDFEGDIYGKKLEVEFLYFIRHEKKFTSVDELVSQIQADVRQIRQKLSIVS